MQARQVDMKIIRYILLINLIWIISIAMCYLDCFIDDINRTIQESLIIFFELLARIVLIVGAIRTFPKEKHSNLKVWFYYAIMGGFLSAIYSFIKLINVLQL